MYQDYVAKAKRKLHEAQMRRKRLKVNRRNPCACRKPESQAVETADGCTENYQAAPRTEEISTEFTKATDIVGKAETWLFETGEVILNSEATTPEEMSTAEAKLPVKEDSVAKAEEWLSKTEDLLTKSQDHSPIADPKSTDDIVLPDEKPRLSIPRNFSEQNLKSHTIDNEPQRCCSKSDPNLLEYSDECSMELIQLDIARTFPHLCIFQPGGPYFDVLHELLAAYVCYRPDIGYVQVSRLLYRFSIPVVRV